VSNETLSAVFVSSLIATAGLWWFRLMLPAMKKAALPIRFAVYGGVWLAYFVLIWLLIQAQGGQ